MNPLAIHWEATLTPPETGDYNLGVQGDGFFRLSLDGKRVITTWDGTSAEWTRSWAACILEKGKPYQVKVDYSRRTANRLQRRNWCGRSST